MRILILGSVSDFLPEYGLAWNENDKKSVYISSIKDNRQSRHLQLWLSQTLSTEPSAGVTLLTSHRSLVRDVRRIVESGIDLPDGTRVTPSLSFQNAKDVVEMETDRPVQTQSNNLLPEMAVKAGRLHQSLFVASSSELEFVPQIHTLASTMTHQTGIALHVYPPSSDSKAACLLSYLSGTCATSMGKRRMRSRVFAHPWTDKSEIDLRQNITRFLIEKKMFTKKLQGIGLARLTDLDKAACQLSTASQLNAANQKRFVITLPALVDSIEALKTLAVILEEEKTADEVAHFGEKWLKPFLVLLKGLDKISTLVHHVMDINKLKEAQHDPTTIILNPKLVGTVQEAVLEVDSIQEQIEKLREKIEIELTGHTTSKGGKVKIITHPTLGRIFRAPKAVQVPEKYTMIRVNKAECQFTCSKMKELIEQLESSHSKIESTETAFIKKTIEVCETYIRPLGDLSDLLGDLDVCVGFAAALSLIPSGHLWLTPEILPAEVEPRLHFVEAKHPILELQSERKGGNIEIVPNTVSLCSSGDRILLVTGPNMGGKSTFARQQALLCLLAQVGCPVPAETASLSPVSLIWPRIGAQDNPTKGVSTFMTEALETALMLSVLQARPRIVEQMFPDRSPTSILVIDELGRGTSSVDGLAFAYGVLHKLSQLRGVFGVFATHFHELGQTAIDGVKPVCMTKTERNAETSLITNKISTFKIRDGVEEDSDGILLAKAFGFPESIITSALKSVQQLRAS